jgi:hypothetical protein
MAAEGSTPSRSLYVPRFQQGTMVRSDQAQACLSEPLAHLHDRLLRFGRGGVRKPSALEDNVEMPSSASLAQQVRSGLHFGEHGPVAHHHEAGLHESTLHRLPGHFARVVKRESQPSPVFRTR